MRQPSIVSPLKMYVNSSLLYSSLSMSLKVVQGAVVV
jgi:hypothetical protein